MSDFVISGFSDGGTKTPVNQDAVFAGTTQTGLGEVAYVIVCDGMGGTQAGEIASASIIEEFRRWFYEKCDLETDWIPDPFEVHNEWEGILEYCNTQIRNYGLENGISLGSTVVMGLITATSVYILNVGDSRAYHLSDKIKKLSKDHSVVGQKIEDGVLTEDDAKKERDKNVLTQCIGVESEINPFFTSFPLEPGYYLFCSDGFYSEISNDEMAKILYESANIGLKACIQKVVDIDRERGETDDISAIVIAVSSEQQ